MSTTGFSPLDGTPKENYNRSRAYELDTILVGVPKSLSMESKLHSRFFQSLLYYAKQLLATHLNVRSLCGVG